MMHDGQTPFLAEVIYRCLCSRHPAVSFGAVFCLPARLPCVSSGALDRALSPVV